MRKSLSLNLLTLILILAVLPAGLGAAPPAAVGSQSGFDCGDVTEIPESECEALVALYEATDGDNWAYNTGWLVTNTPCGWYGVDCDGGSVTQLFLYQNQLSGPIPPEIGNLSGLEVLFVPRNQLSGPIPPEIGNLTALGALILWHNQQLSGPIPSQIGNLTALTRLHLDVNQLSGPIPSQIGNLTALTELRLGGNQLSGPIPPEIGNLSALRELQLWGNQLSGPIPSQIGNLTALTDLRLGGNQLSGPIPPQISNLTALTTLGLGGNQLSGLIPSQIGNLTALTRLSLSRNQLSGELPVALTHLTELLEFYFNDTDLCVPPSGPVPEWLNGIAHVQGTGLVCDDTTFSVSGRVADAWGAGIQGVTMSAGPGASAITDVHGNYTLRLPAGTYEIRPSKLAYSFTPNSLSVEVARDRTGVSFRGENIACAVPLSEPFLQFPLVEHRTNTMDPAIAVTTAWFDHDTPEYGVNYRVMPYTGELKSDNITGWVGASPCMDGYCYDGHNGYDYPGEDGITPIYAAAEGTVVAVCSAGSSECNDQACGAYGKQVWIDHGNSYATHYAHLHTVYVTMTVGTRVTADTPLGTVGCTGRSTGPHLHFATYFNWNLRDPWITSVTSARPNEVVDPFGWEGLEETPPVYDPWDTPSVYLWEQPLGEARPIDASGGQLASPSGRVFVDIPHLALSETTVMSLRPSPVSAPSATLRGTGTGFWLRALWDLNRSDSTLQAQSETVELAKPITVTIDYTDADLTRLDPSRLAIHRWNEGAKTWEPLPTTLDPVARTATALTDNLGAFDLQAPLICPDAVLEPNDSHATASYLTPNEPIRTLFDIPDDEDWFRFEATEGMTYTIETTDLATGVHTILEVYDTNAATLLAQDGDGDDASPSRVVWTAPASQSFYVRVKPAATSVTGCDAYYTLRATPHAGELDHQIYLPVVLRNP